jgi:hypothetical protein
MRELNVNIGDRIAAKRDSENMLQEEKRNLPP